MLDQQTKPLERSKATLDAAFKAMQHWRDNKADYDRPGVPDTVWQLVFQLEAQPEFDKTTLCHLLKLNSEQYDKKRKQHVPAAKPAAPTKPASEASKPEPLQFGEARVVDSTVQGTPPLAAAAQKTQQAVKQLKKVERQTARYLDITTIIIECVRPDGHCLKIHTAQEQLPSIMQHFFNQEASA